MIKGGPRSAWQASVSRITPAYATHNHWNAEPQQGQQRMIDWIIGSKHFAMHRAGVNTWVPSQGHVASDHWPVQAVLSFD